MSNHQACIQSSDKKTKFQEKFAVALRKKCRKKKYRLKILKMNVPLSTCRYLNFRINWRPNQSFSAFDTWEHVDIDV